MVDDLATFAIVWQDGVPIVRASGEIDLSNAAEFAAVLNDVRYSASGLVIDLSEVSYIDSSGIAALFDLVGQDHARVGLVVPESSPIRRVLSIARLPGAAPLDPDLSGAILRLQREPS
jgi:anti-sigma B factor antagonist